jgi:hypothetical protein
MSGGWISRDGKRHGIHHGCDIAIDRETDNPITTWIVVTNFDTTTTPKITAILGDAAIRLRNSQWLLLKPLESAEYLPNVDWVRVRGSRGETADSSTFQIERDPSKRCTCGTQGNGICSSWCDLIRTAP